MAHLMERLTSAFDREGVRYGLVGGYAVALHGAPRGTIDVDCIIRHTEADFEACERALRTIGLEPRLPVTAKEVIKPRDDYIQRRNLIALSFVNPTNPVDGCASTSPMTPQNERTAAPANTSVRSISA